MKLWAGIALVVALVAGSLYFKHKARHGDRELPVYVTGAERMVEGQEIYRRGEDFKPFTYPPFFAVPFVPFTWVPQAAHPFLWFSINFLLLLWILWKVHHWTAAAREAGGVPAWLFWLLTGLLSARHVFAVFENQSHDLLVLWLMVLAADVYRQARTVRAGAWAGLGAACKATPLLFLVVLVLRKSVLGVLAVLATAAAATLLPDLVFPRVDGELWGVAWYRENVASLDVGGTADTQGIWNSHSYLNQSLSGTLTRLFSEPEHPGAFVDEDAALLDLGPGVLKGMTLLAQLSVLALIGLPLLLGRRKKGPLDENAADEFARLSEVGLVLCGMVLLSPMSSKSHFAVLLVPVALCVVTWLGQRRDVVLGGLLLGVFLLGTATAKNILGRELGNVMLAYGAVTGTTLFVLVATALLRWRVSGAPQPAEVSAKPASS